MRSNINKLVAYGYRADDVLGPRPLHMKWQSGVHWRHYGKELVEGSWKWKWAIYPDGTKVLGPIRVWKYKEPVHEVNIKVHLGERRVRKFVQRSLGPVVPGFCVPIPDTQDALTLANGVIERMGRDENQLFFSNPLPRADPVELDRFGAFVDQKLLKTVEPLPAGLKLSGIEAVKEWLDKTQNYDESRKQELYQAALESEFVMSFPRSDDGSKDPSRAHRSGKDFGKNEHLPKMKHMRSINSPEDEIKVTLGPAARYMEEATYANNRGWKVHFIKHVPMYQRAEYIENLLGANCIKSNATDYTSFECSFSSEFQLVCEQKYYRHMLRNYPEIADKFCEMTGFNAMKSGNGVTLITRGRRMSGEMVTSLGNGISNAFMLMYLDSIHGSHMIGAVVEGDDGLFSTPQHLDMSEVKKLGFIVKQEKCLDIGTAGFCGLLYDSHDKVHMTDPWEKLCSFGWTHSNLKNGGNKLMRQLLRAKALSLGYECPGCPILWTLALVIEKCTRDVAPRFTGDYWETEVMRGMDKGGFSADVRAAASKCSFRTRDRFSELFGISPIQQIKIERWLVQHMRSGQEQLDGPILDLFRATEYCSVPPHGRKVDTFSLVDLTVLTTFKWYWDNYVQSWPKGSPINPVF